MDGKTNLPAELLDSYKGGSDGEENNSGSGGQDNTKNLETLEKSLAWLINQGDSFAKKHGKPGLADLDADEFAQLTAIVVQRNLPSKALEKSPELMFLGVVGGLVTVNLLDGSKAKSGSEKEAADND